MTTEEAVFALALIGLALQAIWGVWARAVRALRSSAPGRWRTTIVYSVVLVLGGALGTGLALEAGWLVTIGLSLGLGASVVLGRWVDRLAPSPRGSVPRRPGYDEDV